MKRTEEEEEEEEQQQEQEQQQQQGQQRQQRQHQKKKKNRGGDRSPFFADNPRTASQIVNDKISSANISRYFLSCPSSPFGAARTLRWGWKPHHGNDENENDEDDEKDKYKYDGKSDVSLSSFLCCQMFASSYRRASSQRTPSSSVSHQSEVVKSSPQLGHVSPPIDFTCPKILQSSRHLCKNQCYLRAFMPMREWINLRQSITSISHRSIDVLLKGWTCRLLEGKDESHITSSGASGRKTTVAFRSPSGELYESKAGVLKALGFVRPREARKLVQRDGSNRTAMGKRKRTSSSRPNIDQIMSLSFNSSKFNVQGSNNNRMSERVDDTHDEYSFLLSTVQSPLGLLEELFCDDPFRLLLCTMLLNRTSRTQVDSVLYDFLQRWPTQESVASATDEMECEEMSNVIASLGLQFKRAKGIIRFAKEYSALVEQRRMSAQTWPMGNSHQIDDIITTEKGGEVQFQFSRSDILSFYGCGEYAYQAYRIFIQRRGLMLTCDHALQDFVDYKRAEEDVHDRERNEGSFGKWG